MFYSAKVNVNYEFNILYPSQVENDSRQESFPLHLYRDSISLREAPNNIRTFLKYKETFLD